MAESEGFEPPVPFWGTHALQACAFDRSANSPLSNEMIRSVGCGAKPCSQKLQILIEDTKKCTSKWRHCKVLEIQALLFEASLYFLFLSLEVVRCELYLKQFHNLFT